MTFLHFCRNGLENVSIVFSKPEKRASWEESFNEAKHKLGAHLNAPNQPNFQIYLCSSFSYVWGEKAEPGADSDGSHKKNAGGTSVYLRDADFWRQKEGRVGL